MGFSAFLFVVSVTWGYLLLTIDIRLCAVRVWPFKRPATCPSLNVLCTCAVANDCTLLPELTDGDAWNPLFRVRSPAGGAKGYEGLL